MSIFNPDLHESTLERDTRIILDLSGYVRKDEVATFNESVTVKEGKSLFLSNEAQNVAFTDAKNTDLTNVKNKTTNISYSLNTTTLSGNVDITTLNLPDNALNESKISGLSAKLDNITTNLLAISSNDADIGNLQNSLSTFETSQTAKNSALDISLNSHNARITATENDITSNSQLILDNSLNIVNHENRLSVIETEVDNLQTFQTSQEISNTAQNGINSGFEDTLNEIDTSLNVISGQIVDINTDISTINAKNTQQDISLNTLFIDIDALQAQDITLQTNITNNDNDISAINSSLTTITTQQSTNTGIILTLQTDMTTEKAKISTLQSEMTSAESNISTLQSEMTTAQADIITNTTSINTKHPTINISNRLPAHLVGLGNVTNDQYSTLSGISTASTIESRLTSLTNSINALDIDQTTLENLQAIDLTNFANIGTQITDLQTKDNNTDISLNVIIEDVSLNTFNISENGINIANLQSNVASNTGRLNVKDTEINTINSTLSTIESDILANTSDIALNTSDIGTNQSDIATLQSEILTKQDTINTGNKLQSSLISTDVNSSPDTLDNILQSLTDINATQSTNITNIGTQITNLTNSIASNDTEILALQNQDTTHSNAITSINSSISSINTTLTTKQDEITSGNKLNSSLIFDVSENETLDNIIISINDDIATKQNILNNSTNKLPIDNVDLTGSNLIYVDYASSINSKFASLDGQLSTLTTLQNGDIASFVAIEENFDLVDLSLNAITSQISNVHYLDNVTADVQQQIDNLISSSIPSLSYQSGTTTTIISNTLQATNLKFSGDNSIQTTAYTSTKDTQLSTNSSNISTLQTEMTQAQSDITQAESDILLKQNIINGSNKLDPAFINAGSGSLTSQKMEYLSTINEDINTKLSNIDSVLSNQTTLNTSISSDISTLQTGKQDTLTTGSLNPEFITTSGAGVITTTKAQYLSSITSDLQTQLDGKPSANNTTFTGTTNAQILNISGSISTNALYETVENTYTSYASNVLTYDYSNGAILYFPLSSNTNFQISLTNVPTTQYKTYTFTLVLGTATHKAYANTCKINGTTQTLIANGGLANVDISNVTTSGIIMQQFTIIWTGSLYKVITNISEFY